MIAVLFFGWLVVLGPGFTASVMPPDTCAKQFKADHNLSQCWRLVVP